MEGGEWGTEEGFRAEAQGRGGGERNRRADFGERTSSGILKKIRGRFGMARLKAIESRFDFRYGGFLAREGALGTAS